MIILHLLLNHPIWILSILIILCCLCYVIPVKKGNKYTSLPRFLLAMCILPLLIEGGLFGGLVGWMSFGANGPLTTSLLILRWVLLLSPIFSIFLIYGFLLWAFPSLKNQKKPKNAAEKQKPAQMTPLWETVLKNNTQLVQQAIQQGADINAPFPANGNTPLHISAWNGYAEIAKCLLAQPGINKNVKNLEGKTALDLAKEQGFAEIIALLEK